MRIKKNIALLSLLTGAFVSTSFNIGVITDANYLNLMYEVSSENFCQNDSLIVDTGIPIPLYDSMVPQGLTVVDDYFLTSSYDYCKNDNSAIYVLDKNGNLLNICDIGNRAHVGGISYDSINDFIWVTSYNGMVNVYRKCDIFEKQCASPLYSSLEVGNGLTNYKTPFLDSASFLTVFDNVCMLGILV